MSYFYIVTSILKARMTNAIRECIKRMLQLADSEDGLSEVVAGLIVDAATAIMCFRRVDAT